MTATNAAAAVFGAAPKLEQPKKTAKKRSGKDKERIPFGQTFDILAAGQILMKCLEGLCDQLKAEMKEKATGIFIDKMIETGSKPDSFNPIGQVSVGLAILKKRGANLKIDDGTIEVLNELGIHVDEQEEVPERLVLNPEIMDNQEILQHVADAIQKHPKLQDVVVVMQQERKVRYSVSDETLPQLARAVKDKSQMRQLLERVSSCQLSRFKIEGAKTSEEQKARSLAIIQECKVL